MRTKREIEAEYERLREWESGSLIHDAQKAVVMHALLWALGLDQRSPLDWLRSTEARP